MNLERTNLSLEEQFGNIGYDDPRKWDAVFETIGKIAFGGFGTACVLGAVWLIYTIVTKMILSGPQPILGALLLVFVIFAVLTLVFVVFREEMKKDRDRKREVRRDDGQAIGDPTQNLIDDRPFDAVPSVTDVTTKQLDLEHVHRPNIKS